MAHPEVLTVRREDDLASVWTDAWVIVRVTDVFTGSTRQRAQLAVVGVEQVEMPPPFVPQDEHGAPSIRMGLRRERRAQPVGFILAMQQAQRPLRKVERVPLTRRVEHRRPREDQTIRTQPGERSLEVFAPRPPDQPPRGLGNRQVPLVILLERRRDERPIRRPRHWCVMIDGDDAARDLRLAQRGWVELQRPEAAPGHEGQRPPRRRPLDRRQSLRALEGDLPRSPGPAGDDDLTPLDVGEPAVRRPRKGRHPIVALGDLGRDPGQHIDDAQRKPSPVVVDEPDAACIRRPGVR